MSPQDWRDIYEGIQSGLWGPFKDYNIAYGNYAHAHSISSAVIKTASNKNKVEPYPGFEKVFSLVEEYRSLGASVYIKAEKQKYEMNLARSLISVNTGAPEWLLEAVQE